MTGFCAFGEGNVVLIRDEGELFWDGIFIPRRQ
jgi:hypothetical protein